MRLPHPHPCEWRNSFGGRNSRPCERTVKLRFRGATSILVDQDRSRGACGRARIECVPTGVGIEEQRLELLESAERLMDLAGWLLVEVRVADGCLKLAVSDNGIGFDIADLTQHEAGMGLQNIKKRAAIIGGETAISSVPGCGTTVTVSTLYP